MEDKNPNKKDIVFLDFDNTLYYNPEGTFTEDITLANIIAATDFFYEFATQVRAPSNLEPYFILATGRPESQKDLILDALHQKGYSFDKTFFSPFGRSSFPQYNPNANPVLFYLNYWQWKMYLIDMYRIATATYFRSLTVIDDDPVLCHMLNKLNVRTLKPDYKTLDQNLYLVFMELDRHSEEFVCCHSYYRDLLHPKVMVK